MAYVTIIMESNIQVKMLQLLREGRKCLLTTPGKNCMFTFFSEVYILFDCDLQYFSRMNKQNFILVIPVAHLWLNCNWFSSRASSSYITVCSQSVYPLHEVCDYQKFHHTIYKEEVTLFTVASSIHNDTFVAPSAT